jgi:predicted SAM-dependent methyltransferase
VKRLKAILPATFKDRHRWRWWRLLRLIRPPARPNNPGGKVYVHLGCGGINDPRFVNVDAMPWPHVHHVGDVEKLPMLSSDSADLIYVSHCLEHISFIRVPEVLQEWRRVLKPGGWLRISVPDFDFILKVYDDNQRSINSIEQTLLGGQDYPFNFHKSAYNRERLESLLKAFGFDGVREWRPDGDALATLDDWSRRTIVVNGKNYPISLNLEARKPA